MTGAAESTVWTTGTDVLSGDPVFGPWVRAIGPIRLPDASDGPFVHLVRSICYQQLAGKAAATIHGRVLDALGGAATPDAVSRTTDRALRAAGLSRNKLAAIRDLTEKVLSRDVEIDDFDSLEDEEIVERLVRVRGIGEWTAQMFLMFHLLRPDVWPVGDLGVRAGFAKAHGLDETPQAKDLRGSGEAYRPWRSVAAYYCWRILETELE